MLVGLFINRIVFDFSILLKKIFSIMAENYTVNYNINVASEKALSALNAFQQATSKLSTAQNRLTAFQKKIDAVINKFSVMSKKAPTLDVKVATVNRKLDGVIRKLERINKLAKQNRTITVNTSSKNTGSRKTSSSGSSRSTNATPNATLIPKRGAATGGWSGYLKTPNAVGYKTFGATPLPNNGGMAIDMLKGMGIAYGIAGLGSAISDIVSQATAYDNTMKTVENILKSHDSKGDFSNRFQSMSRTVRNVGMETKFKVTEVADAAKFLAMAGLDVEAIQQAIRPIADIALVGDTELGETADLVTNIMTAYKISPKKMRNAADVMTNTFTMSNTTLTEIAESYKYAASLLSAGGVSFEEATAAIGVLGDAGIKGSQAGTTMRTIMANIVNPTKKQQAAWDALGISTKDENGNTRDLLDIFKDLNAKGLNVSDFYKIFHKTAASGAVALADYVDKWEKVNIENFLSAGLSANLANEKKNTLQGLWAQLTSVFTDQGVTAFGGIQGTLRSWMNQAIGWLKNNGAEVFREVANTMVEFVKTVIDATKWFAKLFEMFSPMIKTWVKFQLVIWPVVKAIQAFKGVILSVQWLGNAANGLRALAISMESVAVATEHANVANAQGGAAGVAGAATNMGVWGRAKTWGKNLWGGKKALASAAWTKMGGMARMGVGALGAYAGMSQITKEDANGWDYASGGLFAAAGMAAMVGGPVGWIAGAGLAVAGLAATLGSFSTNLGKLHSYLQSFANSNRLLDGVLLNSNSRTERMLEFVWRKNYDINELIARRIELSKELHGIESPESTTTKDVGTEIYKDMYERFYSADSMWGSASAAQEAANLFNKYGADYGMEVFKENNNWTLRIGNQTIRYANPDGTSDTNDAVMYDVAAAMEMLHGQYRQKIIDENQKRLAQMLYGKSTEADVREWQSTFNQSFNPANIPGLIKPNEWNADTNVAKYWNGDEVAQSYLGMALMWESLSKVREAQEIIATFKQKLANGTYTDSDVVNALRAGDYNIMGALLADYNPSDINSWYRSQGYVNGQWIGIHGETPENMAQMAAGNMQKLLESIKQLGLETDPTTQAIQSYANTLMTLANSFLNAGQEVVGTKDGEIKTINGQKWRWNSMTRVWELVDDNGQLKEISASVVEFSNSIGTLGQQLQNINSNWPTLTPYVTTTTTNETWGGYTPFWMWGNQSVGGAVTNPLGTGKPNWSYLTPWTPNAQVPQKKPSTTTVTMTSTQMGNVLNGAQQQNNGTYTISPGGNNRRTTSMPTQNTGPKASDYKNHYNTGNAAPKQVIVRIDKLMNVESVDLSNPDNAAVIANLKSELTQALVDVVHDFDETWNG